MYTVDVHVALVMILLSCQDVLLLEAARRTTEEQGRRAAGEEQVGKAGVAAAAAAAKASYRHKHAPSQEQREQEIKADPELENVEQGGREREKSSLSDAPPCEPEIKSSDDQQRPL